MNNRSFDKNKKVNGFTIVELLIVIVVIGILAAITIVSYTGVSNRARTARAQSNATAVSNLAHVYNVDPTKNAFPTQAQLTGYTTGLAKLPSNVAIAAAGANAVNSSNAETTIAYLNNGTDGACIGYYDTAASTVKYIFVGQASSANLIIASPTCS